MTKMHHATFFLTAILLAPSASLRADPLLDSWFTERSGQYARIYATDADLASENTSTTWSRGTINQSLPAYSGVQEIHYSDNWVYIRTTGLGIHIMGPWYLNAARTNLFPNLPYGDEDVFRFPRLRSVPATKSLTGLGSIGYFVDGVAMFDIRDGFYWNGTAETSGPGTGYWNRDAVVNEGVTLDPALGHQERTGTYHYHANPIALRHLLGDNVGYDPVTGSYNESPLLPQRHSPIIGWARDGFPMYGPYGFSHPLDPTAEIRRMVSGFTLRNGLQGTDNLTTTGRTTLPAWAARAYNISAAQPGPSVSSTYPLGRYIEDHAYLGDIGFAVGVDFDLDEHNGRFCVTPEFPQGTYAYFITLTETGTPAFPYHIGRTFHGQPSGGAITQISETVSPHFLGGPKTPPANRAISRAEDEITLVWDTVEGGHYQVIASPDLSSWQQIGQPFVSESITAEVKQTITGGQAGFYRLEFTGEVEPHLNGSSPADPPPADGPITQVSPNTATRGTSGVVVTFTLDANATPSLPPAQVVPSSVTIGAISGTSLMRINTTTVRATFAFPQNGPTGAQTVTISFPGPGGQPGPSYQRAVGFTIQP